MGRKLKVRPTPKGIKDRTGFKQGKLTILGFSHRTPNTETSSGMTYWVAECECGKRFKINSGNLISRGTSQCKECGYVLAGKNHSESAERERNNLMLNMSGTPGERAYKAWSKIKHLPGLPKKWKRFDGFVSDVGCPVNNKMNLHYPDEGRMSVDNTFWSSVNKSKVYFVTESGERLTTTQLSEMLGISRQRVDQKYRKALEKGVDPLEYIMRKNTRGQKVKGEYEKLFDGNIHTIEFETEKKAEAFCASIKSYFITCHPNGKYKTRRLENIAMVKFTS